MHGFKRTTEANQRSADRKRREDEAPRLKAQHPDLLSLAIAFADGERGMPSGSDHVRRVVVETAPMLFDIACTNRACRDGGHDLTSEIGSALRGRETRFEGSDPCRGSVGSATCSNVLTYVATATYRS
jgi:hypothetical protein